MKVELGRKYRDQITGFSGVCTGNVKYITGCDQALLTSEAKDGKMGETSWFDIQRLVPDGKVVIVLNNSRTPGPDAPAPIK